MNKQTINKLRSICMWYKQNTPVIVRLYILQHLLRNQLLNFNIKQKSRIQTYIDSIQTMINEYYTKSTTKGKLQYYTVKTLKGIKEYNSNKQKDLLEQILFNTLKYYNTHLKKIKRFQKDDTAVRILTSTGNHEYGILVHGFLEEIRTELK